jgi:hypothetical protein
LAACIQDLKWTRSLLKRVSAFQKVTWKEEGEEEDAFRLYQKCEENPVKIG